MLRYRLYAIRTVSFNNQHQFALQVQQQCSFDSQTMYNIPKLGAAQHLLTDTN